MPRSPMDSRHTRRRHGTSFCDAGRARVDGIFHAPRHCHAARHLRLSCSLRRRAHAAAAAEADRCSLLPACGGAMSLLAERERVTCTPPQYAGRRRCRPTPASGATWFRSPPPCHGDGSGDTFYAMRLMNCRLMSFSGAACVTLERLHEATPFYRHAQAGRPSRARRLPPMDG